MKASELRPTPRRAPWGVAALGLLLLASAGIARWRAGSDAAGGHRHDREAGIVAERLASLPAPERLPYLLRAVRDPDPGMRLAAVDALESFPGSDAAGAVETAFLDYASRVRQRALEVLPRIDAVRGHRLLLRGLQDEDGWIRETAASYLSLEIGRERAFSNVKAIPLLIRAMRDPLRTVAVLANGSLRKITGRKEEAMRLRGTASADEAQRVAARWERWWKSTGRPDRLPADWTPQRPTLAAPAPAFSIQSLDGRTFARDGQRGRVSVLHFWGTWCAPCQTEMADLQAVRDSFAAEPLDILGVAVAEPRGEEGVREWTAARRIDFPQALADAALSEAFGDIHEVPVTFVLDPAGRIRYRFDGERDARTLRAAIGRLLNERAASAPAPSAPAAR